MRSAGKTGDGRMFDVTGTFSGDLIVEFNRRPDEPEGLSEDRFIVRTRSVVEAALKDMEITEHGHHKAEK